jgi:dipeptidyl aminopeptidase/acylaminoacyl peptidase
VAPEPRWARRFTAPQIGFPRWWVGSSELLAVCSSESGSWQAWSHDLVTGRRQRVTDEPVGVEEVHVAPDGRLVWWHDASGDELGRWLAAEAGGRTPTSLVPDVPDGWSMGIAAVADVVALGLATTEDYRIYIAAGGRPAREVWRSDAILGVGCEWPEGSGGLSADASLLCVRHGEHGDILNPALRVLDVRTGEPVGDLRDPGRRLEAAAWSPVPGDQRLALLHERGEAERPAIWDLATGERRDLEIDLPGGVFPIGWWPDGSALLARHEHEGIDRLVRIDPATGGADLVADPGGEIEDAAVRPDGIVWLQASDSVHPPRVLTADGHDVLSPPGEPPPAGRPYRTLWFTNPAGQRIQAFVVTPEGDGPFPTVMSVHGGPEWHERDRFDAETQAFVDEGFAVALVNYRGSTGYGIDFRRALHGNIGFPESEDVVACLEWLVAERVADPGRVFFSGWSWGGYLACLNAGLNPDRWRAVFAGIPTGDYVAAHRASAPPIQAWDTAVMGGSPDELPELYRERDPMTYVARVAAPVLVIAGENDSRCPMEGVTPWVDALRARGIEVELHTYPAGHHENRTDGQVLHMGTILSFFGRYA